MRRAHVMPVWRYAVLLLAVGFAALALLFVLAGCGSDIDSGYVTKKVHEPAYWQTNHICTSYNQYGMCVVSVPITTLVDERWRFDLREGDQRGWVYVDADTWQSYEQGQHYPDAR